VTPPLVQVVGALACGPKTVKVIVPPAVAVPPESTELIELAEIVTPAVPVEGAEAVVVVAFLTTVKAMPLPHVPAEAVLLESPP
jgi:hypothetical protein